MTVDIRVRGYHLDIYQHVNHARFLEFLEEARWEFILQNGFDELSKELNIAFVIVNVNVNYWAPAFVHDLLRVSVAVGHLGNKSARFQQTITKIVDGKEAETILDATITFCLMDQTTEKAIPITGRMREAMEKHQLPSKDQSGG